MRLNAQILISAEYELCFNNIRELAT